MGSLPPFALLAARGTEDHVLHRCARGNHGENVVFFCDLRVNDHGPIRVRQGLLENPGHVTAPPDPKRLASVALGELHEVRIADQVHAGKAVFPEQVLPLAHHAEEAVVDDEDLDRELQVRSGGKLVHRHLKPAVAHDGTHQVLGPRELGADGRGEPEPHCPRPSRGDPLEPLFRLVELGRPHLVLAHIRGHDGRSLCEPVQLIDDVLGLEGAPLMVVQRVCRLPSLDLLQPFGGVPRLELPVEVREHRARVTDNGAVHWVQLVDLRGVDVHVDLHRVGAEGIRGSRDPVVPARPHRHDQVAVDHRFIGVGRAVHAEHPEAQGMGLGERSLAQQGVGDRDLHLFRQDAQLCAGPGDHRPVADQQHGPFCLVQHPRNAGNLVRVSSFGHMVARQMELLVLAHLDGRVGAVTGNVDENGAGSPRLGEVEGLPHHAGELRGGFDQIGVLHYRKRDPCNVGFLECVHPQVLHAGLPRDHDHGYRVHLCREDARDGVGCARARGDQDHAGLTACAGKAVGHVGGALLVTGQHQLDGRVHEGIEQRNGGAAGEAEHVLDPLLLQDVHHGLGAREGASRLCISHLNLSFLMPRFLKYCSTGAKNK